MRTIPWVTPSPINCSPSLIPQQPKSLDAPERLGGGHAGGADGGQQAGEGADEQGGGQAAGPGPGRDDQELVVGAGVGGGGDGAEGDAGGAAGGGQQYGFGEELGAGGAQRAAQPDLLTAFQHGDDHDVGDADAADEQGDGAEAEEQGVQGALGVGLGGERGRGLGHGDLVRVLGTGLVGEQMVDSRGGLLGGEGADIDLRGMAVKVQVLLG